ncbi:MAG: aldolase [Euryarchaeota archaeon]|nr:aldolase [Euryarchaeota archaeon]
MSNPNPLHSRAIGTWLSIPHPTVAEALAGLDYDFAVIDTEHASTTTETVENMIRAIEAAGDTAPLARVAWNDPVRIKRLLDTGVAGLMLPMVETSDEAREVVAAMSYPPEGGRGIAASRASGYELTPEYVDRASDDLTTIVQIETEKGVGNATEIAGVSGIDALFVGPADLSGSLGVFGQFDSEPFTDALTQVIDAGEKAEKPVGTLATDEMEIERWHDAGFDFLIAGTDIGHLQSGGNRAIETYRSLGYSSR